MYFYEKFTELMNQNQIKTSMLSKKTGLAQGYISDIRSGKTAGTEPYIKKLIDGLEVSESEEEELWVLWSFAKGKKQFGKVYSKLLKENKELKGILESANIGIDLNKEVDMLKTRLNDLRFFEKLLELPDGDFLEVAKSIKEKLVVLSYEKNQPEEMKKEIEECEKMIKNIEK